MRPITITPEDIRKRTVQLTEKAIRAVSPRATQGYVRGVVSQCRYAMHLAKHGGNA